jgi:plastocyanin
MAVLFYLLCALPLAFAQYGGGSASTTSSAAASTTSSGASSVQTITVGQSGLKFSPESVVVAPGKSVVFQFYPGNHSVIQSAFDTPCAPANASAFFSGFVDSSSGPAVSILLPTESTGLFALLTLI